METRLQSRTVEILGKTLPQGYPLSAQEIFNLVRAAYDKAMLEHLES